MAKKYHDRLRVYTYELASSFARWDHIYEHGCSDPFHEDGVNLNLVRNHIIHYKKEIEDLLKDEQENTFFSTPYPDIYYRETPEQVDYGYMARADEIRQRAVEQLALYDKDPNYQYILAHFKEVFPKGETRAHRAAGIHPGMFSRFVFLSSALKEDNLVDLRRSFRTSYEENKADLAERAKQMQSFLEADHSHDDTTHVEDTYDEEFEDEFDDEIEEEDVVPPEPAAPAKDPKPKKALDAMIQEANSRRTENQPQSAKEEQLSLF